MQVLTVTKVVDDGRHNAFTDLYYWAGSFYLVFCSALARTAGDARLRILRSADAAHWQPVAEIDLPGEARHPKFLAMGKRLFAYATAVPPDNEAERRTCVSFTEDGEEWTQPAACSPAGRVLWRPRIHGQTCYAAACERLEVGDPAKQRSVLLESADGLHWREVSVIYEGEGVAETELWFERDDRVTALVTLHSGPRVTVVAAAGSPYTTWSHRPTHHLVEAPVLRKVYRRYLVAGRFAADPPRAQTALFWLKRDRLEFDVALPSGGDTGHPGCCWLNEDELLMSYHSGHEYSQDPAAEVPAAIYIARLGLDF